LHTRDVHGSKLWDEPGSRLRRPSRGCRRQHQRRRRRERTLRGGIGSRVPKRTASTLTRANSGGRERLYLCVQHVPFLSQDPRKGRELAVDHSSFEIGPRAVGARGGVAEDARGGVAEELSAQSSDAAVEVGSIDRVSVVDRNRGICRASLVASAMRWAAQRPVGWVESPA
jgi:hypothetical protein